MKFSCEKCDQHFTVDQDQVGLDYECPTCGYSGIVPDAGAGTTLRKKSRLRFNLICTGVVIVILIGFGAFLQLGLGIKIGGGSKQATTTQPGVEAQREPSNVEVILVQSKLEIESIGRALVALNDLSKYPYGRFRNMRADDADTERYRLERIIDKGLKSQKTVRSLLNRLDEEMSLEPGMSPEFREGLLVLVKRKDEEIDKVTDIQESLELIQTLLKLAEKGT